MRLKWKNMKLNLTGPTRRVSIETHKQGTPVRPIVNCTFARVGKETMYITEIDVHEYVHRDIIMKVTKKMRLYRLIYYS
jgi:hypothetical protein